MLVYGDHDDEVRTADCLADIERQLQRIAAMDAGRDRHAALVTALIEAGRLQQGVADAQFDELDRISASGDALGRFTHQLAKCVVRSWDSGGAGVGDLPHVPAVEMPGSVTTRDPEGYAFYAVYPEAYADAARALELTAPPRVIGLRSIGTSLAAIVAAALDAPPPVTLRPFGDPFARRIALSRELQARLLDGEAHYIVVDEGPGLSGSSFSAVVDWLRERGVPVERIAVLPSHDGAPGARASAAHREQWAQLQRTPADIGPGLPDLLSRWVEPLTGPLDGPLVEVSGGRWRRWAFAAECDWPAIDAALERRKFLAFADGHTWLVKFAGLGGVGQRKLRMARSLFDAGLSAEPLGLVHGFLVERWHGSARRLAPGDRPLAGIGHYIGTRARLFAGEGRDGASIAELLEMMTANFGEAGIAWPAEQWRAEAAALQRAVRPTITDNRMMPHEWLRMPSGALLKSDALDHHRAHDLIGCQDMAWDIAGAIVEFGLCPVEAEQLADAARQESGRAVDPVLLAFCLLAYPAFRIGQLRFARERGGEAEAQRAMAANARIIRSPLATDRSFAGSSSKAIRPVA